MVPEKIKEVVTLAMIGESVVGMVYPRQFALNWKIGPRPVRKFIGRMAERPHLLRALWAAQAGIGIWLVARKFPRPDKPE